MRSQALGSGKEIREKNINEPLQLHDDVIGAMIVCSVSLVSSRLNLFYESHVY